MADGLTLDTSELRRLQTDLGRIPARAVPESEAVLKRAAQNLKEGMVAEFDGSPHFERVGAAVSYERRGFAREIAYEIGPEVGRGAGSLAGIAVEGGANGGGGSVKIDHLLEPEAVKIEKHLLDVLMDSL